MSNARMILWLGLLASLPLAAQTVTGNIVGTVMDTSGQRMPNTNVKATNVLTGGAHNTLTNGVGDYILLALPVGQYKLEVEAQGFKRFVREGIGLDVNQNARVDVRLELGQVTQEVLVREDAPLVESRSVQIGGLVDTRRINDLPLNGRNVYSLVSILPGVSGTNLQDEPDTSEGSQINVNGSRVLQTSFLLDGGLNHAVFRNGGQVAPNPESVEEFRLITSNYNAEYGRNSGGVVNVVSKSGTNQLHGSLYDFLRNDAFDARGFFQPSVSKLRQNQFGGTVGGPALRDKLFYFFSYQGFRQRAGQFVNSARTPTAAQRLGDFSALPANQRPRDPNNNQPFPNGLIPASRLDPVALNLANKLVALPNTPDGRVQASRNNVDNNDHYFGKADYLINPAHRLSASLFWVRSDNLLPLNNTNIPDYAPVLWNGNQRNITANETWTISPAKLNQFIFSLARVPATKADLIRLSWPDFGSKFVLGALPPRPPRLVVTGGWQGGSSGDVKELDQTFAWSDNFTWVKNAHTIKAGGSLVYLYYDYNSTSRAAGLINIGTNFTGNGLSDYLLGRATSFDTSNAFLPNLRSKNWAGFFQDDWKISRKITLNLGLRYEIYTPFVDIKDGLQQFNFGQQSRIYPNAPVGLIFPGDTGVPRGLVPTDYNNFAPRIGVAIDPFGNGKTAVRVGYGVFYSVGFAGMANSNVGQPFQIDVTAFGTTSFVDPYAELGGNPFPIPAGSKRFVLPVQAAWMDPHMRTPYVEQYSFTIQQQLMRNVSLDVAYVGNASRKLQLQHDANQAIYIPGRSTPSNVNDRRPYLPGTYGLISHAENAANAAYNSLQTTLNRRFVHGFTLLANYTYSKAIDIQSSDQQSVGAIPFVDSNFANLDRGVSGLDRRHVFNMSFVWEPPKTNMFGFVGKQILSDWQINGIARYRSGAPFTVQSGSDSNLNGVNNDRPNQVGDPHLDTGRSKDERIARYFDPAAFRAAPTGTNGNVGRNTLYGPGGRNWDVSFFKNFPLYERHHLQFRAEFFNFFNQVSFAAPVANLSNANVGRIQGAGAGRVAQFSLRYAF